MVVQLHNHRHAQSTTEGRLNVVNQDDDEDAQDEEMQDNGESGPQTTELRNRKRAAPKPKGNWKRGASRRRGEISEGLEAIMRKWRVGPWSWGGGRRRGVGVGGLRRILWSEVKGIIISRGRRRWDCMDLS